MWQLVWCVIVTGCVCFFNKDLLLLLLPLLVFWNTSRLRWVPDKFAKHEPLQIAGQGLFAVECHC